MDLYRWVNNGGMFIAHNAVRLDEYKRLFTAGRDNNYDADSRGNFLPTKMTLTTFLN